MFALYIAAVVVCFLIVLHLCTSRPNNFPPGPRFLPVVGNFTQVYKQLNEHKYYHSVFYNLSKKYGNVIGLKLGRNLIVVCIGADAVNEILTREEFDGRPDGFFFRLRSFGKRLGLVFTDGNNWKKHRKFSVQHLRTFGMGKREMDEKIQYEVRVLMEKLKQSSSQCIFMHNIFDISVLNVLWTMITGERYDLDDIRLKKLLKVIHDAFKIVDASGGMLNQLPFLRFIAPDLCGYNTIVEILTSMWDFLKVTIEEHKKTICTSPRDLIDAFLCKMRINQDASFTDEQLISICLDLFMAGSETTSNTLCFACIFMLLHPDVQKKVQTELDQVVGRNRWPELRDRINLKYVEVVLMEIQRIANIPPMGIPHRSTCDTELYGHFIPKDTMILTSLHSVHMDTEFWGDPHVFRPERFLSEEGKIVYNERYFIPFGNGKRRCLGEALGKSSLFLFFTGLMHNFTLNTCSEGPQPQVDGINGFTISPQPFKAFLIPRID